MHFSFFNPTTDKHSQPFLLANLHGRDATLSIKEIASSLSDAIDKLMQIL